MSPGLLLLQFNFVPDLHPTNHIRYRCVDGGNVSPVHDLLKVTADYDRVSFWCNVLFDVHWFLLLLNSSMWFNWEMCFPGGIIPAEGCEMNSTGISCLYHK